MSTLGDVLMTVAGGLAGTSPALGRGIRSASDVFNTIQRKKFMEDRAAQQEEETARQRAIDVTKQATDRQAHESEAARIQNLRSGLLKQLGGLPEGSPVRSTLESVVGSSKDPARFISQILGAVRPPEEPAPPKPRTGTVFDEATRKFVHSGDIQPGDVIRPGPTPGEPEPPPEPTEISMKRIKHQESQVATEGKIHKLTEEYNKIVAEIRRIRSLDPVMLQTLPKSPESLMREAEIKKKAIEIQYGKLKTQMQIGKEVEEQPRLAEDQQKPQGNVIRYDVDGNRVQ